MMLVYTMQCSHDVLQRFMKIDKIYQFNIVNTNGFVIHVTHFTHTKN